MPKPDDICCRCKKRPVEVIDDFVSSQCGYCNDRDVERTRERDEWNYYHPPLDKSDA